MNIKNHIYAILCIIAFFYTTVNAMDNEECSLNKNACDLVDACTKAIKSAPNNIEFYEIRGLAYEGCKFNIDNAIMDFTTAITINPQRYVAYTYRAQAYSMKGDYDKAIQDSTQAISINPQSDIDYSHRGDYYFEKSDYDKAIQDYTKAIIINNKYFAPYYGRGNVYYTKKDYDSAILDYSNAIIFAPADGNASWGHMARGNCFYHKGDYDSAIEDFSWVIESSKYKDANAYLSRGNAFLQIDDYESALEDYTQAIKLDPNGETGNEAREQRMKLNQFLRNQK